MVELKEIKSKQVETKSLVDELIENSVKIGVGHIEGTRVGKLVSIQKDGRLYVDYKENRKGLVSARTTIDIEKGDKGKQVLLVFENSDPSRPIIIGLIKEPTGIEYILDKKDVKDIIKDGKRMVFDAKKEIELRCGKSSIIMKKNGEITIRGSRILSRATDENKVKGGSVQIN